MSALVSAIIAVPVHAQDWKSVEDAMGRPGVAQAGDAYMAMGDLVLADSEVTPVLTRLQQGGVEQTAIHHHLLHESPRVIYMHVHAHGDAVKIAETIRANDDALKLARGLRSALDRTNSKKP